MSNNLFDFVDKVGKIQNIWNCIIQLFLLMFMPTFLIYSIISKIWKTKWLKKDWPYNFLPEMNLSKTNLGNSFLASSHKNNIEIKNIDININKNNWIIQWSQLSISTTVSNILNSSYFVNKVKQIIVHNHFTHAHTVIQTWNVDVRV